MRRILVTGNAASGKSTLARRLSGEMGIPFHSLDSVVWLPGWRKRPEGEKLRILTDLAGQEAWVIDGVSAVVQAAADAVIFLDVPRRTCIRRALWRSLRFFLRSRSELPEGCPEILMLPELLRIIRDFPARAGARILRQAGENPDGFHHIRTAEELERCLECLRTACRGGNSAGQGHDF